nr:MAG TPA: hypothetical protein [Bacteriophage sp.]
MERLTKWEDGSITYNEKRELECGEYCDSCSQGAGNCKTVENMIKKLATYEDLEEQGLLVRLPCKVGDMVWDNDFGYPESYEIKAFSYGYCDSYVEPGIGIEDEIIFYYENYAHSISITGAFPMSEIGKTVFLTREEAVKKLEELKNEI